MGWKPGDLQFHEETERADEYLSAARTVLLDRIEASKAAGDAAAVERYEAAFAEIGADAERFVDDPEFRKTILEKYPKLLESLR